MGVVKLCWNEFLSKANIKKVINSQRSQKNWTLEGFHLNSNQVTFQTTLPNLFVSTQVTKELKIGRLLREWRPSAFSKYSTKSICFHTGHRRTENWKAFTWMATKCCFKILYQIDLFHKGHKRIEHWKVFTWMATKWLFKLLYQICLFPHRSQKNWKLAFNAVIWFGEHFIGWENPTSMCFCYIQWRICYQSIYLISIGGSFYQI